MHHGQTHARFVIIETKIANINDCQLYLNIIHLSNMIYPDGKTVNHNYLVGVNPT